jgi:integrase
MPKKSLIVPSRVNKNEHSYWRVIIPADILREGEKREQLFTVKEDATDFITELKTRRGSPSFPLCELSIVEKARLAHLLKLAGSIDRMESAVTTYVKTTPTTLTQRTLTEAIAEVVDRKRKRNKREVYVEQLEDVLNIFRKGREQKPVSEITKAEIEAWLDAGNWKPWTKVGYLGRLGTLFSFCKAQGYVTSNPTIGIEKPSTTDTEIGIISYAEAKELLRVSKEKDPEIALCFALQLFGYLRPSEALRLTKADLARPEIIASGHKTKTRMRRVIPINETLRSWIDLGAEVPKRGVRERVDKIRAIVAVRWTKDCLRHSCVSNSYPLHGAVKTSQWSGHDEDMLFRHYRALVTDEEAKRWWTLTAEEAQH